MDEKLKQVLHKVELLCDQNPEFTKALAKYLGVVEIQHTSSDTTAFIQLQRKNMRQRGRLFYQDISNATLRNQLVNDYAMMLWYKCINDIPHMFAHILFQTENMLNTFILSHGNAAYNDVESNPDMYTYHYQTINQKPFTIVAKGQFFDTQGNRKSVEKISIWAKYTYWYVSTQQTPQFQTMTHNLVSDIINFRNYTEHRNSQKETPEWLNRHILNWTTNIETKFGYIDVLLSAILQTMVKGVPNGGNN